MEERDRGTRPVPSTSSSSARATGPDLDGRDLPRTRALVPALMHLATATRAADVAVSLGRDGAGLAPWTTVVTDAETTHPTGPGATGDHLHAATVLPDGTGDAAQAAASLAAALDTLVVGRGLDLAVTTQGQDIHLGRAVVGYARTRRLDLPGAPALLAELHLDLVPVGGLPTPSAVTDALLSTTLRVLGARPAQSAPTQGVLR